MVFEVQVRINEDPQIFYTALCFQKFFEVYSSLILFYRTLGKMSFQDLE